MASDAPITGAPTRAPVFDDTVLDRHSADLDIVLSLLALANDAAGPGTSTKHVLNAIAAAETLLRAAIEDFDVSNRVLSSMIRGL